MILLSIPLKNDPPPPGNYGKRIFFFLDIEIVTTKIVNSKSLKKNLSPVSVDDERP